MASQQALHHFISHGVKAKDSEISFFLSLRMEERSASNMQKASSLVSIYNVFEIYAMAMSRRRLRSKSK